MAKFTVKIWAYDHYASFDVEAEDNVSSIEKSITWESTGMFSNTPNRITYEEVVDGRRPIQTKEVLGVEVATGA